MRLHSVKGCIKIRDLKRKIKKYRFIFKRALAIYSLDRGVTGGKIASPESVVNSSSCVGFCKPNREKESSRGSRILDCVWIGERKGEERISRWFWRSDSDDFERRGASNRQIRPVEWNDELLPPFFSSPSTPDEEREIEGGGGRDPPRTRNIRVYYIWWKKEPPISPPFFHPCTGKENG